jgi:DNA-binding SARP family transcriptional activator
VAHICIRLFGRFQLRRAAGDPVAVDGAKVQELLAYLLIHRRRACRREALADVLWPETAAAQARKYFRQTLWQLQVALDGTGDDPSGARVLIAEPEWLQINPAAAVWLDVDVLESALDTAQGIAGKDLTLSQAAILREAVRVYDGDLLEAWPHEWCLYERERLLVGYLQILDKLMGFCEAQHAYDEAVDYGAQILRTDRARERTHRHLMRLHYLAGDRSEALRQYGRCVEALRAELGVAPSAKTRALHAAILADRLEPPASPAPTSGSQAVAIKPSLEALRSLLLGFDSHIRSAIAELERLASSRA